MDFLDFNDFCVDNSIDYTFKFHKTSKVLAYEFINSSGLTLKGSIRSDVMDDEIFDALVDQMYDLKLVD